MVQSRRLNFHAVLAAIPGVQKVYFQPPDGERLLYPCILYERDNRLINHANNHPYRLLTRYMVTVIDSDPDSLIPDKVALLPTSAFNRFYTTDGLNHDVYTLYF